jgi:hypothetical protein
MCRQCDELLAPVVEEEIGGDDEPGSMQFYRRIVPGSAAC